MNITLELSPDQKAILYIIGNVEVLTKKELEYINNRLRDISVLGDTLLNDSHKPIMKSSYFDLIERYNGDTSVTNVLKDLRTRAIKEMVDIDNQNKEKNSNAHYDLSKDLNVLQSAGLLRASDYSAINNSDPNPLVVLTPKGQDVADRILKRRNIVVKDGDIQSRRAFIACAFGKDDVEVLCSKELEPMCKKFETEYVRIDNLEPATTIAESILTSIRECLIIIADLTYARPSVYFEVGYALGLGIPVLLTCRKDHLDRLSDEIRVHFDLEQFKISFWSIENDGSIRWQKDTNIIGRFVDLLKEAINNFYDKEIPNLEKHKKDSLEALSQYLKKQ